MKCPVCHTVMNLKGYCPNCGYEPLKTKKYDYEDVNKNG